GAERAPVPQSPAAPRAGFGSSACHAGGRERAMSFDRRDFLRLGGASIASILFGACDSQGPRKAQRLLAYMERKNQLVERALFRHTAMDHAGVNAKLAGENFPSYFVSTAVPVWDPAAMGAWKLEIGGMVKRPISLSLDDLMRLDRKTQRVNHYCVEG